MRCYMKNLKIKKTTLFLLLVLSITMLCSCNDNSKPVSTDTTPFVINVDGKEITVENPANDTIKQLFKKANIKINDGDVISVDTDSVVSQGIVVNVLRKCKVTVKDEINNTECTVILIGATVKDAIAAAGVELPDNYSVNQKLNAALENEMEIIISEKAEPETTTEEADEDTYENNDDNDDNQHYTPSVTRPTVTKPATTRPAVTTPPVTTPPTTKPPVPTTSGRTIVNIEIYEDCDGSGHGVKVITYSDGTQEEVPF
ncbi:MAG: DUF348 domain-containing protein [Ruminococcaceae bacterium]|nr:DUF348 domain-containing protein [Oscillospiraceae bacterium]